MNSVREIIKEACSRVNLVPRRQAVPGDILETGYNLLKGIVNKYNYDNLLSFTQNSIIVPNKELTHIYDETDLLQEREDPRYDEMQHVQVRDVMKINSLYFVNQTNEPYKEFYKFDFVPYTDFDKYPTNSRVFTMTQKSEGEWLIQIKPAVAMQNYRIKINYNEGIDFDLDSDLYIPDNYIELLIVALAHKLALQYPRLDDAQMQRLENEVRVLVDNVRTPKAATRVLKRADYWTRARRMSQAELEAGAFLRGI